MAILEACNDHSSRYDIAGFVVDEQYGAPGTLVDGLPIVGGFEWIAQRVKDVSVICGVGQSDQRRVLVQRLDRTGVRYACAVHPAVWCHQGRR